ncbi:MAG TPA: ribonuclease H-like domain-containing protein [Candidatus Paceibacterota bacterium]|nr:ribonuclease H-like domain-containing protein [Candidatus Paceibacterota bacterium]
MREITFDIETRSTSPVRGRLDINEMELIVVGVHDSETGEYVAYEREELPKLWPVLERADMLIGYNSDYFDIPLLNRYYPGDLTKIRSLDLMAEVYRALGRRLRLDSLAQATLGKGKIGEGALAGTWWDQGLRDKVKEYCLMDVRLTRELYDYALKHSAVKYKDLNQLRDIKLDTSAWRKESEAASMTHTLPF